MRVPRRISRTRRVLRHAARQRREGGAQGDARGGDGLHVRVVAAADEALARAAVPADRRVQARRPPLRVAAVQGYMLW